MNPQLGKEIGNNIAYKIENGLSAMSAVANVYNTVVDATPDLDTDTIEMLRKQIAKSVVDAHNREYIALRQDWQYTSDLFNSMQRIAYYSHSPGLQREVNFLSNLTEFGFQASMATSATSAGAQFSAALGAVGALLAITSMFQQPGPDPNLEASRAILQNQELLLSRINVLSERMAQLRLAVQELENDLYLQRSIITTRIDKLQTAIEQLRENQVSNEQNITEAFKQVRADSAFDAAAMLRKQAPKIYHSLEIKEENTTTAVLGELAVIERSLTEGC